MTELNSIFRSLGMKTTINTCHDREYFIYFIFLNLGVRCSPSNTLKTRKQSEAHGTFRTAGGFSGSTLPQVFNPYGGGGHKKPI